VIGKSCESAASPEKKYLYITESSHRRENLNFFPILCTRIHRK
jgi:hypothetical protein